MSGKGSPHLLAATASAFDHLRMRIGRLIPAERDDEGDAQVRSEHVILGLEERGRIQPPPLGDASMESSRLRRRERSERPHVGAPAKGVARVPYAASAS